MFLSTLSPLFLGLRELLIVAGIGGWMLYRKQGVRFWSFFIALSLIGYCASFVLISAAVKGHEIGVVFASEIVGCGGAMFSVQRIWDLLRSKNPFVDHKKPALPE